MVCLAGLMSNGKIVQSDEVLYDARWIGNHGIGRFAAELQKCLPGMRAFKADRKPWHALDPALLGLALRKSNPPLFFSPGYNSPVGWSGEFVFTLHDLNHLRVPDNSNALKRAYYEYVIKPACKRADVVLTVSDYSRREIAAWAGVSEQRIVNVGNGVGKNFSPAGRKYQPGYPYLLYVGSRKSHKNLKRLLQAFALTKLLKDVRLLFSGHPNQELLNEITRLRITEKVVFAEMDSDDSLSQAYRGATGFVFPSLYEGFGLPPLEAMACGIPVLTSNVCSLPEVMGGAALLVDPLDVDEIAGGITQLVLDSQMRDALRTKGLARAARFTWQRTAEITARAVGISCDLELEAVACGSNG